MLDRYRTRQPAPAAPEAPATTGAEITAQVRAAPAAPAAPAEISEACADATLEHFATAHGIDWTAARSQMIEGDAQAGAAQLAADTSDGIEAAGVACWLRVVAERALSDRDAPPTYGTSRDTQGRALPLTVRCGDCANFAPNPHSPDAGIGTCARGEPDQGGVPYFPIGQRRCAMFAPVMTTDRVASLEPPR